jgi:hypothetical protein
VDVEAAPLQEGAHLVVAHPDQLGVLGRLRQTQAQPGNVMRQVTAEGAFEGHGAALA